MTTKIQRQGRIVKLTNAVMTEKFTWKDIRNMARKYDISEPTVKSYIDEVKARLKRANWFK